MQWNGKEWVAEAPPTKKPKGRVRRIGARAIEATLVTALAFGLIAGATFAAKGGGHLTTYTGGTISLAPLVVDADSNGVVSFGDTVTFTISTTATTQPFVNLVCNQGAYNSWRGYFVGSLDSNWNFVLGSGGWSSGAGDCTAYLGMYTKQGFKRLASTSFHVDA